MSVATLLGPNLIYSYWNMLPLLSSIHLMKPRQFCIPNESVPCREPITMNYIYIIIALAIFILWHGGIDYAKDDPPIMHDVVRLFSSITSSALQSFY